MALGQFVASDKGIGEIGGEGAALISINLLSAEYRMNMVEKATSGIQEQIDTIKALTIKHITCFESFLEGAFNAPVEYWNVRFDEHKYGALGKWSLLPFR